MAKIATAPNQKTVTIKKEPCDKKNLYALINLDAMSEAMKVLCVGSRTPSPFVLWSYLAKNQDGFQLAMSNVAFSAFTGMSKDAYDYAVKKLIEEGYLIQEEGNKYTFHERRVVM